MVKRVLLITVVERRLRALGCSEEQARLHVRRLLVAQVKPKVDRRINLDDHQGRPRKMRG
jgi:hypothetical protein